MSPASLADRLPPNPLLQPDSLTYHLRPLRDFFEMDEKELTAELAKIGKNPKWEENKNWADLLCSVWHYPDQPLERKRELIDGMAKNLPCSSVLLAILQNFPTDLLCILMAIKAPRDLKVKWVCELCRDKTDHLFSRAIHSFSANPSIEIRQKIDFLTEFFYLFPVKNYGQLIADLIKDLSIDDLGRFLSLIENEQMRQDFTQHVFANYLSGKDIEKFSQPLLKAILPPNGPHRQPPLIFCDFLYFCKQEQPPPFFHHILKDFDRYDPLTQSYILVSLKKKDCQNFLLKWAWKQHPDGYLFWLERSHSWLDQEKYTDFVEQFTKFEDHHGNIREEEFFAFCNCLVKGRSPAIPYLFLTLKEQPLNYLIALNLRLFTDMLKLSMHRLSQETKKLLQKLPETHITSLCEGFFILGNGNDEDRTSLQKLKNEVFTGEVDNMSVMESIPLIGKNFTDIPPFLLAVGMLTMHREWIIATVAHQTDDQVKAVALMIESHDMMKKVAQSALLEQLPLIIQNTHPQIAEDFLQGERAKIENEYRKISLLQERMNDGLTRLSKKDGAKICQETCDAATAIERSITCILASPLAILSQHHSDLLRDFNASISPLIMHKVKQLHRDMKGADSPLQKIRKHRSASLMEDEPAQNFIGDDVLDPNRLLKEFRLEKDKLKNFGFLNDDDFALLGIQIKQHTPLKNEDWANLQRYFQQSNTFEEMWKFFRAKSFYSLSGIKEALEDTDFFNLETLKLKMTGRKRFREE